MFGPISNKISRAINIYRNDGLRTLLSESVKFGKTQYSRTVYIIRRTLTRFITGKNTNKKGDILYPYSKNHKDKWVYHDENWCKVIDRWKHREAIEKNRSLTLFETQQNSNNRIKWKGDNNLKIKSDEKKADRWVYLHLTVGEHYWRNYKWSFEISRSTDFKELQFGFRYQGFYNRYRFRYQDSAFHYDIVLNGRFYNSISVCPFKMEKENEYKIDIIIKDNRFILKIDNKVLLDEYDFMNCFSHGPCAIILWEEECYPPIKSEIDNMSVVELVN